MRPKINLDTAEESLRNLLVSFGNEYSSAKNANLSLRFVGGWVRDKLLGRSSYDIDVALEDATGEQFASALTEWLKKSNTDAGIGNVHVILSNPAKSKHLETATCKLFGMDIDFTNLRCDEIYSENSRVPSSVKFGTPQEDAFRRDATLNALFYNLQSREVEDWTGRGLQDLNDGILRTPLDPRETFKDDPLRILRLIRFVGQLGFDLAPETAAAIAEPSIAGAIQSKVSRERIGTEVFKLVESPNVLKGMRYIVQLGLAQHIFTVPAEYTMKQISWSLLSEDIERASDTWSSLPTTLEPKTCEDAGIIWLAVTLQRLRDIKALDRKKKEEQSVSVIIRDGIKRQRRVALLIARIVNADPPMTPVPTTPHILSRFVRERGEQWRLFLAYSALTGHLKASIDLAAAIEANGLTDAWALKPKVDGKSLVTAFSGRKPGPWLQPAVEAGIDYQVDHPEADVDDIVAHIRQNQK